jgi:adenylate cyclase class IV
MSSFIITILLIILVIVVALIICKKLNKKSLHLSTPMSGGGGDASPAPVEYEYQFPLRGKNTYEAMIAKLKKMGAKREGQYLMSIIVFTTNVPDKEGEMSPYMRVRRETQDLSTFTVKTGSPKFPTERELDLAPEQADTLTDMLLATGHGIKYRVEKIRERWTVPSMPELREITFDQYPGLPTYMEVDAESKPVLKTAIDRLGLDKNDRIPADEKMDGYTFVYGIPTVKAGRVLPKGANLVFDDRARDQFDSYLSDEQKREFDAILKEQIALRNKLSKK